MAATSEQDPSGAQVAAKSPGRGAARRCAAARKRASIPRWGERSGFHFECLRSTIIQRLVVIYGENFSKASVNDSRTGKPSLCVRTASSIVVFFFPACA